MLDFQHLPQGRGKTDIFYSLGSSIGQGVQIWNKPRNATMLMFVAIAGGGGGGAGFTRAAGTAGGGGGSGACSGVARFIVPAQLLPDYLYLQVGAGGKGGVPGVSSGAGATGTNSFVSLSPPTNAGSLPALPNIIISSGVNAPGGGGGGAVGAAGTAGTVPSIAVVNTSHLFGNWLATVGLVGLAGGAHTGAAGVAVTAWAANICSPGASGGGIATTTNFAGGAVSSTARLFIPGKADFNTQIVAAGVANGGNGNAGWQSLAPLLNSGGSGGGTSDTGQGGHGGAGGYGCGGGGGGAGATGGNGGNGGSGLIIITSW